MTIEPIHRSAYEHGSDPIDHLIGCLALHIGIRDQVLRGDICPGVPITQLDQRAAPLARRLVALILDAGWTPPYVTAARKEAS